ncbi:MAG: polyhydroxyalkanoate depolymerase [Candidatus Velthaea sp.]
MRTERKAALRQNGPIINYELYDATYLAMTPARWSAATAKAVFGNPFNPLAYTMTGRMVKASADVFDGFARRRAKPAWHVDAAMTTVDERPFCRLVRFSRASDRSVPRVLLVAPLSGHFATLLRGTVDALVADHDVYVTDWSDAREVPRGAGRFDLDDYIAYLLDYLRMLGPHVHVMAVCQPAPAVLSAVALLAAGNDAAQPQSMILMGGPIDTRAASTAPTKFAASHRLDWFEREATMTLPAYYRGGGRRVYPGFMQLGAFLSMNAARHVEAHVEIYNDLVRGDGESAERRRAFYDEYLSVMDVTAEYYLQTVDVIFQRHLLPKGTMTWRGNAVEPAAIRATALMTVEGELDDISAPPQTYAAHALCANIPSDRREQLLASGVGHYGIFNGRRWRRDIAPRIAAFMRAAERSQHAGASI